MRGGNYVLAHAGGLWPAAPRGRAIRRGRLFAALIRRGLFLEESPRWPVPVPALRPGTAKSCPALCAAPAERRALARLRERNQNHRKPTPHHPHHVRGHPPDGAGPARRDRGRHGSALRYDWPQLRRPCAAPTARIARRIDAALGDAKNRAQCRCGQPDPTNPKAATVTALEPSAASECPAPGIVDNGDAGTGRRPAL